MLVVLTGPSRGIGRATAQELAHRKCDLALIGRPSGEFDRVIAESRRFGVQASGFACDLRSPQQIREAGQRVLVDMGIPDAVVHNAGIIQRTAIEETSLEAWDEQIAVNLRAPFLLTKELLPAMRQAGQGRIVIVSSIAATLGTARAAGYCAAKWGAVGFMKSLAEELKDSGLMTVAVLPGSVDTRMLEGSGFEPRMTPEDVARTLVHYALDAPLAHNGGIIEMFGV